ncbi:hypothetical protein DKL61_07690 [Gammaproteobacteria bacterium ESL0073]|uniref:DUF1656 domain-containing protein n=1 Tax=Entomomonas moraniae TaxID=2213226 RepID=A0A3S9XCH3_9GAMM|nr:hypothetical protein DKL61_07690 [Gammaproteobacteria bacterium ESL0073]AZS50124.1 DUF1656 domain-containing protein [Entomomonas moraniae]
MKDLSLGSLIFFPYFVVIVIIGLFLWLLIRISYRKIIFNGNYWHPGLIDIGVLFICLYVVDFFARIIGGS